MVVVDGKKCVGCGLCVAACPREAITAFGVASIDQNRCSECFGGIYLMAGSRGQGKGFPIGQGALWRRACVRNCPVEAIGEGQG